MNICYLEHASDAFVLKLFLVLNKKTASKIQKVLWVGARQRGENIQRFHYKNQVLLFSQYTQILYVT